MSLQQQRRTEALRQQPLPVGGILLPVDTGTSNEWGGPGPWPSLYRRVLEPSGSMIPSGPCAPRSGVRPRAREEGRVVLDPERALRTAQPRLEFLIAWPVVRILV
jgi:hypothetical protein